MADSNPTPSGPRYHLWLLALAALMIVAMSIALLGKVDDVDPELVLPRVENE